MEKQGCLCGRCCTLPFFLRQIEINELQHPFPKPRLFMGCSCSLGSGPSYSSHERTTLSGHCFSGESLPAVSACFLSLQCDLRALADSVIPTQSSWLCCTSKTFWLTGGHEKILLSPVYNAARQPVAGEGGYILIFLRFAII